MEKMRGKSFLFVLASLVLLFAMVGGTWTTAAAAKENSCHCTIPTISILSVKPDESVTIKTANYPANDTFKVYMNYYGTLGLHGIEVDSINSESGGSFEKTFTIPSELKGQKMIAIRLESPTSGYYSYNWFYNTSSGTIPDTGKPPAPKPPFVIPTFSITAVDQNNTVTIKTANFPANDTFNVMMNYYGTAGIGGVKVDTIDSKDGGTLTLTFTIPDHLKGQGRIAIRLESPNSGYYSYNWFYNNTYP